MDMFKKLVILVLCMGLVVLSALTAGAHDDINTFRECHQCGMDRKVFGYSRMLVIYEDDSQAGVCSLHCAVTEINEHKDKKVKKLLVADRDSHSLIEADKAVWVLGGKKRGVMTDRAKWAFATMEAAEKFVDAQGGKIIGWEEALAAAREDAMPRPH
jgi:copper chaperone NosL